VLLQLADLMPNYQFNSYGASVDWIGRDRALLRDTVAAMIEANRLIYRDRARWCRSSAKATEKTKEAVEYAIEVETKNCIWSVNTGFDPKRTDWTIDNSVENGDIEKAKRPTVEQVRMRNWPRRRSRLPAAGDDRQLQGLICSPHERSVMRRPTCIRCAPAGYRKKGHYERSIRPAHRTAAVEIVHQLDQALPFANMRDTPYYRDCIYEQFSKEYERRYAALRTKMREHKLDVLIVPGGPSHELRWRHAGSATGNGTLCCYVVVPLEGEPTMVYSMGGTHAEAVRRQVEVAITDVRYSRSGRYADIMVERIRELTSRAAASA
jgi:hypothetical protein